jgi:putative transposase
MTDHQWQCINDVIPPAKTGGRPRSLDMRQVVNAMLYIVVSGCQWRMLPKDYPKWQRVYHYFRQWRDDGTWQRIHDTLRAAVRRKAGCYKYATAGALDSQRVTTTQVPGIRGDDSGTHGKGRTRHLLVDTLGVLLVVVVTAASVSENAGARLVLARLEGTGKKLRRIWVDGGYRGTLLDWAWDRFHLILERMLHPAGQKGFVVQSRRWVVERTFAWLTRCRRLSVDDEGRPERSEAWISLAMIRLMIQRLAHDEPFSDSL